MMKIDVIGCGSAFSIHNNTSALRVIHGDQQWLIDCGPTVPRALWQRGIGVNDIQVIYFTHIHPDHSSGLAVLINQWKSFKRFAPLIIYCQKEQQAPLEALVALAVWPLTKVCFEIEWRAITESFGWQQWQIHTAFTQHEMANRALRISLDDQILFYSGDGRPTEATMALMQGANLAFQECASFSALEKGASHGDFPNCQRLMENSRIDALGLYHCFDEAIGPIAEQLTGHDGLFLSRDGLMLDLAMTKNRDFFIHLNNKDV